MNILGYCYFIGIDNEIKIGYSNNVQRRLKQLQTSHGKQLLLLGYISNCTKSDEKNLHNKFHKLKINREIFKADEELIDYININNEIQDNWVEIENNQIKLYKRMKK
jgi:hypothetical protein